MLDEYLNHLGQRFLIPEDALTYAKEIGSLKRYEKGELLVYQGSETTNLYCVIKGIISCYGVNDKKEWTSSFFKEGDLAGDYKGSILGEPSERSLKALEECLCFCLPFQKMTEKFSKEPWFQNSIGRYMSDEYSKRAMLKMDLMSLTPASRYDFLKKKMPWLLERVSNIELASFMEITPVSLSRIKKRHQQ